MLGQRLKKLRSDKGVSVKDVCDSIKVPLSTYRSWEEGAKIVGEEPYLKLSSYFKVSLLYLITGESEQYCLSCESSQKLKEKLDHIKQSIFEIETIITIA